MHQVFIILLSGSIYIILYCPIHAYGLTPPASPFHITPLAPLDRLTLLQWAGSLKRHKKCAFQWKG